MKTDKQLKRGNYDWRITEDGIVFMKWMDKRAVYLASNFLNPLEVEVVNRKRKDGNTDIIPCPRIVKNYNYKMGFVDKADMLKSVYELNRKSKKWWHRILWHFVDVSFVNSYIIYKTRCDGCMDLKTFRLSVATGLIGASTELPKKGRPSGEQPVSNFKVQVPLEKRWDRANHMPIHSSSSRCALCSSKAEQYRTRWSCSTCGVGLCLSDKKKLLRKIP